ncbi:MAG: halocarboxylic acid dehydrogenase DehI family protein [Dehalococcoidia bacterium]|nr:halocarboxylic acid dehydrogenase DehI family protein [Dehalococcoidia bacterium]
MSEQPESTARLVAAALRAPFIPDAVAGLARAGGYLDAVWPQLAPSMETAGFLGSALYMADMAADGVEEVYEPVLSRASLLARGLSEAELDAVVAALDVFYWVQPQLLLLTSALAEAMTEPSVGGQGRPEPRQPSEREQEHVETALELADGGTAPLPAIAEVLNVDGAPDLYRAIAAWPAYLEAVWEELQHLVAYPDFRRRGRALYFYARSSSRFLAQPIEAGPDALAAAVAGPDVAIARSTLQGVTPVLATMMMHCSAMRVGLGVTTREVVTQEGGGAN